MLEFIRFNVLKRRTWVISIAARGETYRILVMRISRENNFLRTVGLGLRRGYGWTQEVRQVVPKRKVSGPLRPRHGLTRDTASDTAGGTAATAGMQGRAEGGGLRESMSLNEESRRGTGGAAVAEAGASQPWPGPQPGPRPPPRVEIVFKVGVGS